MIDPELPQALVARTPDDGAHLVDLADLDGDGELRSPHLPGFTVRLCDVVVR